MLISALSAKLVSKNNVLREFLENAIADEAGLVSAVTAVIARLVNAATGEWLGAGRRLSEAALADAVEVHIIYTVPENSTSSFVPKVVKATKVMDAIKNAPGVSEFLQEGKTLDSIDVAEPVLLRVAPGASEAVVVSQVEIEAKTETAAKSPNNTASNTTGRTAPRDFDSDCVFRALPLAITGLAALIW